MTLDAADAFDAGEDISMKAACCKMFTTEASGRIADKAVQIHGGAGYMSEYKVERFYRDVPPSSSLRRNHTNSATGYC